jgi:hypothetical protein
MKKNDCASDLAKEVSKASEVLDLKEVKALLNKAVLEAKQWT